jgi:hypothetical protein
VWRKVANWIDISLIRDIVDLLERYVVLSAMNIQGRVSKYDTGIKRKTCDIRTWIKHLFLEISFINIDTLFPSLYQCVETRRIEVF